MNKKFISWRRVSTFRQSKSGLGLAAQKEIIRYFIERDGGEWVADYEECYTGKELSGCVELHKAMAHAKATGAVLIIAKSDRFRNTAEALKIYEEMGDGRIMFCDLPATDKFTLTLFFALAEREALLVSIRTKQALAAKKERGEATGGACRKWKESFNNKSRQQKKEEQMRKGETKRNRHQGSRDMIAFQKVLTKVFPDYTVGEPDKWNWRRINCKEPNRTCILNLMADYKEFDKTLFVKWDFRLSSDDNAQKVRSYLQSFKRSYNVV